MEPVGPRTDAALLPPPVAPSTSPAPTSVLPQMSPAGLLASAPTVTPIGSLARYPAAVHPQFPPAPDARTPGHHQRTVPVLVLRAMTPWRVLALMAILAVLGSSGWQVQRLVDGQVRSMAILWASVAAGLVAAVAVLMWTYAATENSRRLVSPATTHEPPEPWHAVATWALPMTFFAVVAAVVAYLTGSVNTPDDDPSSIPMAIAVLSVLLAVPMAFLPFQYMSRVVRQVGGHSADLGRWMWVPMMLGVVGVATIAGLHVGGALDNTDELAPMWAVAVVAIAPCAVVVLLGWRAAESVEEAIVLAAARRAGTASASMRGSGHAVGGSVAPLPMGGHRVRPVVDIRDELTQVPGSEPLRLGIVVGLAGLALLGIVGAIVMVLFWIETRDGVVLPSQRDRSWDMIETLTRAAEVLGLVVLALVAIWSFVAVLNARLASSLRRNPVAAALAWPAAAIAIWLLSNRLIVDSTVDRVVLGFVAQAVVLYVPFVLLERAADAVGARRTPTRMTYVFALVLLVYSQALVTLSDSTETVTSFEFGRLAGFLALGAVVVLLATLAVTEACRSITNASAYEAQHHNALVAQRRTIEERAAAQAVLTQSSVTQP